MKESQPPLIRLNHKEEEFRNISSLFSQSWKSSFFFISHLFDRVQLRPHPGVCGDRHHSDVIGGQTVEHQGAAILLLKQDAGWDILWHDNRDDLLLDYLDRI